MFAIIQKLDSRKLKSETYSISLILVQVNELSAMPILNENQNQTNSIGSGNRWKLVIERTSLFL